MKFEELYEKYLNKTATAEEVAYVEDEIAKAKKLAAILDEKDAARVIAPSEDKTVKHSVRRFLKKTALRIMAIVLAAVVLVSALGIGGFFAIASMKATSNSICDKSEAVELCKKWLSDAYEGVKADSLVVREVDRELALHRGFAKAYYEYDIEISHNGAQYEFWVDSFSGEVRLVDKD